MGMRINIAVAVGVVIAAGVGALVMVQRPESATEQPIYLQNNNYLLQKELYDLYRTSHADVVMLGDSHIHGANWNELLGHNDIVNRGIRGDITSGFLNRIEQVTRLHPRMCFIMGGINDLYASYSPKQITENIAQIVQHLRTAGIVPVAQTVMFVDLSYSNAGNINRQVSELNNLLKQYATAANIRCIDVNAQVCRGNFLRREFTVDGIHLNAAGYRVWSNEVEKIIRGNGLE